MKNKYFFSLFFVLLVITGCRKDLPEPETKVNVMHRNTNSIPVLLNIQQQTTPFVVQYEVRGKNVFVECFLRDVSFRSNSNKKNGKIHLFIDGEKKDEIRSAAFIIKGLSKGKHLIELNIVKPDNKPYQLRKKFSVVIE
ncbi:hypothetical protein [Bacillus sp. 03113]|uniref:hypothetical protein n=1 Tax=Bacillus sp. 03113 TaxID=2578211 RepID=UPI00215B87FC|nr:hypothetical protein [Bacillus sp. 03113]